MEAAEESILREEAEAIRIDWDLIVLSIWVSRGQGRGSRSGRGGQAGCTGHELENQRVAFWEQPLGFRYKACVVGVGALHRE